LEHPKAGDLPLSKLKAGFLHGWRTELVYVVKY